MKSKIIYICSLICMLLMVLAPFTPFVLADTQSEKESALRAELEQIEKQIKQQQAILAEKQKEGASMERDVAILDAKINQAKLRIKEHNLAIERLGKDIVVKSSIINTLDQNIDKGHESLGQIMRQTNQIDDFSLAELFLGEDSLSNIFGDLDYFDSVNDALSKTFNDLRDAKKTNEAEKQDLDKKRNKEIDTRINVEAEKKKIEVAEQEKKRLLSLNKAEQSSYQKEIADKAARANAIRTALFGLRDSAAIPFGTALEYAKEASKKTGVRPAFILAILTQESNLGANVGSCYLTDKDTGAGIRISTGAAQDRVMKPSRDVAPFLEITEEVGRDWKKTRVSCPFTVGFGGAMGPSQFIPSTWNLFKARIAKALGVSSPDPWNAEHAIMASAIYLGDLGATDGSYTSERNAACRYYSGKACSGSLNNFYGDQVTAKAKTIQANIDILDDN